MVWVRLTLTDAIKNIYRGSLPLREGWHLVGLRMPGCAPRSVAMVSFSAPDNYVAATLIALVRPYRHPLLRIKLAVAYIGDGREAAEVRLYGVDSLPSTITLLVLKMPIPLAIAGVWLQNPAAFASAKAAVSGRIWERFRKAISAAAIRGQDMPRSYTAWIRMFDTWTVERMAEVHAGLPVVPDIRALVFCEESQGAASSHTEVPTAMAATLASLDAQHLKPTSIAVAKRLLTPSTVALLADADWIAVLEAGEVVPAHGFLALADFARRNPVAQLLYADEDQIGDDGVRAQPMLKPEPSLTFMCSGLLSRGIWLVRPALLVAGCAYAEEARLQAWFQLPASARAKLARRLPLILTHRHSETKAAPVKRLTTVVNRFLLASGVQAQVSLEYPMRLQWRAQGPAAPKVTLIVPSRLSGNIQLSCLKDILQKTSYSEFEVIIVVTQTEPLDPRQERAAQLLRTDQRVRVERLDRKDFNYSAANNFAFTIATGEFICLLNDDVSTLDPCWLEIMVAMMSDPQTGVVGAKLYYPNMTVQHGGVIMGLAGLVQHVNRFLPRGEPGYMHRGVLDQEFCCVTGACLLVRRCVYELLGGLDEQLPTAFNDVDFCLRARSLSYGVVLGASVELIHHETISFGHHYADNFQQEARDVALMRKRWRALCQADPFHNPSLSLVAEAEWELAYPPRTVED